MIKSHPRNYFFKTGIGETKRKFAEINDINLKRTCLNKSLSIKYSKKYRNEITKIGGYLDKVFSFENPIFHKYCVKVKRKQRVAFRTVVGISAGADSALALLFLCESLENRYKKNFKFETDEILVVSFFGKDINKEDISSGQKFVKYIQAKYPNLPIKLHIEEIKISDFHSLIENLKKTTNENEYTENVVVALDFHKAALLNQIAEGLNYLHIDTTNITEEIIGETTDGTGGFGQVAIKRLPKSLVYSCLQTFEISETMRRRSLDTCTGLGKVSQYVNNQSNLSIEEFFFFQILDEVILRILLGEDLKSISKKTGHNISFIKNLGKRIFLCRNRENIGGNNFSKNFEKQFERKTENTLARFWELDNVLKIFNLK